ncbi:MAG: anhydro-N-acetylmuramic acid kinase [Candidatus Sumerlaeia bacterium]|nr:anhydro-N-acetylmuramic acid kinase [Candidatus Sumerlaeia bacterium]
MWERLRRLIEPPERLAIGLMSGTSADGIDAVLVRLHGHGSETRVETLAFHSNPYPDEIRDRIVAAYRGSVAEACSLNFELGGLLAEAALEVAQSGGVPIESVAFVASHGQTLYHIPRGERPARDAPFMPSTLQVGEGALIAQHTGILTITDFRTADMAAGGGGAPLVPLFDELVFRKPGVRRVVGNIGGIANVTFLGTEQNDGMAFDTGPGNALIDLLVRLAHSPHPFDKDGEMGARGEVNPALLARLMSSAYIELPPPKTTGRELFDIDMAKLIWAESGERPENAVAVATALTAATMSDQIRRFGGPVDELILSGGGVHNPTLMRMIRGRLPETRVVTTAEYGVDPDAKEAIAFAVIGNETLHGAPGNVPRATGARRPAILGKLSLP